ncbi:MAG: PAS domain-containing protein [candidate division Zixibacteria bacterium]|nr:PAS domain-containing protein [candidate division Zixibacteria bacterium]
MKNDLSSNSKNTGKPKLLHKQNAEPDKSQPELIATEEDILKSGFRFFSAVKEAPLVVFTFNKNGIIISLAGGSLNKLGIKSKNYIGKSVFSIFKNIIDRKHFEDVLNGKLSKSIIRIDDLSFETHYSQLLNEKDEIIGIAGAAIDISERKSTEDKLNSTLESLNDFKYIVAKSPAVVFRWRFTEKWPDEWHLEFLSDNIFQFGYKANDVLSGRISWQEISHPDDAERLEKEIADYIKKGITDFSQKYRIITKSGEIRWIEDQTTAIKDSHGKITHFQGILFDVTERKQAEEELRETYKIISKSPAAVFLWKNEQNWPVEFVTNNVKKLFGYTAEEFVAGQISYDRVIHPDDLDRVMDEVTGYSKDEGIEGFTHKPYRIITKDGDTKWIDDIMEVRKGKDGKITHYQGIVIDITERKEAEEELQEKEERIRAQFKGIPIPTYSWKRVNNDFELVDYNDAAMEITQNKIKDLIGVKAKDLYHDKPEILRDLRRCFNNRITINKEILYYYKTTGESKYLSVRYAYVPSDLVIVHTEDITEIKQIEMRNEVKLQFLANLRSAANINECLRLGCMAICEAKLFKQAIVIINNSKKEITNLEQIGSDDNSIQSSKDNFVHDMELLKDVESRKYRISNSYFIPEEANAFSEKAQEFVEKMPESANDNSLWKTGDRHIVPIIGIDNQYEGLLYVDTPFNKKRPALNTVVYLEEIIDIVMKKVHELQILIKLQKERQMLQEKNIALKEILSHIEEEKVEFRAQIAKNIDKTIMPAFTKLIKNDGTVNHTCYSFIMNCLEKFVSSAGGMLYSYSKLSGREKEVCTMIMGGATSKEIANDLNIALATVCKYREKIRKKLGLTNKKINLITALKIL